ncbi:hypothetical protein EDB84DRAFT_1540330, partial [Lactarius hengduanensis]
MAVSIWDFVLCIFPHLHFLCLWIVFLSLFMFSYCFKFRFTPVLLTISLPRCFFCFLSTASLAGTVHLAATFYSLSGGECVNEPARKFFSLIFYGDCAREEWAPLYVLCSMGVRPVTEGMQEWLGRV